MHIFEFHTGFESKQHGEQFHMDCPFCQKTDHFFYNGTTFQWDCKVCGKNGNHITFIRELYELFDNITTSTQFVANLRDLPLSAVSNAKIKKNNLNGSYIIPTFKFGKMNNLYKLALTKKEKAGVWSEKWAVLASPSPFEHTLFNWDETTRDTIWICEGQFDKMAGEAIIGTQDITSIGVPGCAVWKSTWTEVLSEKDVVFCYDNDSAGRAGYEKVILNHIASSQFKPKSISYVAWPEIKKEGYDLNDTYKEYGRSSFKEVSKWIKPYDTPQNIVVVKKTFDTIEADKSCTTYEDLLQRFESVYHTTDDMRLCILLVLSSIYSTKIEGEQLWLRIIGPPSSGKTTIAKLVSGSNQVVLKSTFTGLFSGFRPDDGSDASMIPQISGKTLIVKDADALLRQNDIERIFSELRDFYDKDSSTGFRHGHNHDYRNIRSTMILCGTNSLRKSDNSFLGERFIDYELRLTDYDREQIEIRMMQRSMMVGLNPSSITPEMPVIAACKGFIEHIMEKNVTYHLNLREQTNVRDFARLATTLRTKVDRSFYGDKDITFEPVIEVPARLIGQYVKTYQCAPVILGETVPGEIVHNLVAKITRDIIDYTSPRMKVCKFLKDEFFSVEELSEATKLGRRKLEMELLDLYVLKLVDVTKFKSTGIAGAHVRKFKLKENLSNSLNNLGGFE